MVFCGESIITEISVYVSFYMSEFIIQSTFFSSPWRKERSTLSFVLRIQVEEQGKFIFKVKFD